MKKDTTDKKEVKRATVPYFMVPSVLLENGKIGMRNFIVYCCLLKYRNNESGECWPAVKTIADSCGLSENSVRKSLEELEKIGFMEREKRSGESYSFKNIVSVYDAEKLKGCTVRLDEMQSKKRKAGSNSEVPGFKK